ncbi:MAG: hypothetical protein HKN43_08195 [Rhodothermales bacterium]|nr:hypothetical protein [Rhodothermales bacterium]
MTILDSSLRRIRWSYRFVFLLSLSLFSCTSEYKDFGSYRVVTATDGLWGLRCQPRTELYFLDRSSARTVPVYLGTCSTPRFVTKQMHVPGDPSCFAISDEGTSLVYFHRPNWCGAGEDALRKAGGVYVHSETNGDTLLYSDNQVGQIWSRAPIESQSIRVGWKGSELSRSGAVCSQNLIIRADGSEAPEGEPRTIHGCPPAAINGSSSEDGS